MRTRSIVALSVALSTALWAPIAQASEPFIWVDASAGIPDRGKLAAYLDDLKGHGVTGVRLPVNSSDIILMQELGKAIEIYPGQSAGKTILPADNRHYIKTSNLTKDELSDAFKNALIIN